jgi:hypothetical protein
MQHSVVAQARRRKARGSFSGTLDSRGSPGTEAADVEMRTPLRVAGGMYARPDA